MPISTVTLTADTRATTAMTAAQKDAIINALIAEVLALRAAVTDLEEAE